MKFPKKNKTQENSFLSVHHQIHLSIHQAVCQSHHHHQLKAPQENPLITGEKCGKLPHEILVKLPTVHSSCIMSMQRVTSQYCSRIDTGTWEVDDSMIGG